MRLDAHGSSLAATSDAAVAAFDHVVDGFLKYRADTPQRLARLLHTAPDLAMAHCLRGCFAMLATRQDLLPAAIAAAAAARALADGASAREQAHIAALEAWTRSDLTRALAIWETILARHPHDLLALRLAHFIYFWLGRPEDMAASVARVLPQWSPDDPSYASLLACHCFALEECGDYAAAEPAGRQAIARDPGDLWATHGVAHVMEMQGRREEGIAWLAALAPNWTGGNNLQHHLWWHCALFHLERGDHATVLDLYDRAFRDLAAPLTVAQPDLNLDVQNAASMLFRLQRLGQPVGDRWEELADHAEARIGDCLSAFTLPHWMMALAAAGRDQAAERMLAAMRDFAAGPGDIAPLVRDYALPVCEAVRAHAAGRHGQAVTLMRPAVSGMHRLGGSHAQQDVLQQLFVASALAADLPADVALILSRRRHLPPEQQAGWRGAARHRAGAHR